MSHSVRNTDRPLPPYEEQKRSGRDIELARRYPERAKRVLGWAHWPHPRDEIAAIREFMETGDDSRLPSVYQETSRCPSTR